MPVPSYAFLAFSAVAAILINISSAPWWRRTLLLVANLAFFLTFAHGVLDVVPFAGLLAFGFASVKLLESGKRRAAGAALIVILLLAFFWFKRYAFVPGALLLPFPYVAIGMSYVFFRVLHLVIDAWQEALPQRVGPVTYINYTLNFTCLVSGPIQMFAAYLKSESESPPKLDWVSAAWGLQRIITGFFKVSVVSALLFSLHERTLAAVSPNMAFTERAIYASLLLAIFPIYLYFNFSGYTDFVIGVARFLRLELPENFDRPFFATSVIDFWGRWHMTLSTWLKTYVYSPLLLTMMRRFPATGVQPYLGVIAYFVTFFLVGAWHGQTLKFLFFGLLTGLGISLNKLYEILAAKKLGRPAYRQLIASPLHSSLSRGLNFLWFCFTMLWFWSTLPQLHQLEAQIGLSAIGTAFAAVLVVAALGLTCAMNLTDRLPVFSPYMKTAWYTALAVVTISCTAVLNAPAPHIVYKAF
ncbi:MAG: hypothetical protein M3N19_07290 [Candidatus Eremiobacteraeota bacterium]|nr:hypothetical protein [Candidatus Eremiobacteraeota bacterium]